MSKTDIPSNRAIHTNITTSNDNTAVYGSAGYGTAAVGFAAPVGQTARQANAFHNQVRSNTSSRSPAPGPGKSPSAHPVNTVGSHAAPSVHSVNTGQATGTTMAGAYGGARSPFGTVPPASYPTMPPGISSGPPQSQGMGMGMNGAMGGGMGMSAGYGSSFGGGAPYRYLRPQVPPPADPRVVSWFQAVDHNGSGHIDAAQLRSALMNGEYTNFVGLGVR